MTCLRFWGGAMRVDGFRFDLASILGRDRKGNVHVEPPVIEAIAEDGVLADAKLIAEPWDAAGLYQVGKFPFGRRWGEWNGKFRDDVRRFWRGEAGFAGTVATRVCGSSDLYEWSGRLPRHSVNFVTCHDGFTLSDLVSYNGKHNEANGEQNRDGSGENYSWNCGAEGPTDDPAVNALRLRQAKNLMATLLLSQGVPMILAGDEFLRTQRGNNNAWCQDNEVSWVDWRLAETNKEFLRFVREMIWLRRRHPALRRRRFFVGELSQPHVVEAGPFPPGGPVRPGEAGEPEHGRVRSADVSGRPTDEPVVVTSGGVPAADIRWHGVEPNKPDFSPYARHLAFTLDGRFTGRGEADCDFYVAMNTRPDGLKFRVPPAPTGRRWHRVADTAKPGPDDFLPEGEGPVVAPGEIYPVAPFSLILLVSEP
jgi:glycogen operon protein